MDSSMDAPAVLRRKRIIARQQRDKTPEPRFLAAEYSEDESSSADQQIKPSDLENENGKNLTTKISTADDGSLVQSVSMQIRPPGKISAHESKILRRRNKGFGVSAARSQSQPRERDLQEELFDKSDPEISNLLRTARRSLSSSRHRDGCATSESGQESSSAPATPALSPEEYSPLFDTTLGEEKYKKLQKNLQKFDDERRKFDLEKKKFEREKREIHKIRYRQLMEGEERRRMLESRRVPSDSDDQRSYQQQKMLILRKKSPQKTVRKSELKQEVKVPQSILKHRKEYESSSPVSESDSVEIEYQNLRRRHKPLRVEPIVTESPPIPPERKRSLSRSLSRNRSLSPIKNKTEFSETLNENNVENKSKTGKEHHQKLLEKTDEKVNIDDKTLEVIVTKADVKLETKPSMVFKLKASEPEMQQEIFETNTKKENTGFFSQLSKYFNKAKKDKIDELVPDTLKIENLQDETKIASKQFLKLMYRDCKREFEQMKLDYPEQLKRIRIDINICISHFVILSLFCGFGGLMFRFIEGGFESSYKCEVRKIKRDFIDTLWLQSHSMREDDWKTEARNKLRKFEEELHVVHEMGLRYHVPKNNKWDFINSIIYCLTVITSIGYGHIAPQTVLGRSVTIIYAIIGIPMFLILLADFGKLFTRCIKFVWGFLRRLYYTGTCRKVRKNAQMQNMMKSIDMAYDVAIRRPSMFIRDGDIERNKPEDDTPQTNPTETPTSQYPGTIIVDDEFNLPISVASSILIAYILCGAIIYNILEDWTYFESFYFVFISMSTIGFGDLVPNHPIFMMCSILYLIFGLALTSMFINVVQIKLSDSFKHASAKISATIGLSLAEEESKNSQIAESPELAAVHRNNLGNILEIPENSSPPPLLPRANKDVSPKR